VPELSYGTAQGKVAVVTGASRGIGAAIARRLASDGAAVACVARTLEPDPRSRGSLNETVAAIETAGGTAIAVTADLSKSDDRRRLVDEAVAALGHVDILVNNAAVTFFIRAAEFPEKRFRLMMDVQVWSPFELIQLVLPGMRERNKGWILNISSRAGINPQGPPFEAIHAEGGFTVYGLCKAALERMTTGLAAEHYADGIAVNALAPWGVVPTPGAGTHDLVKDDIEAEEVMAEAALALCTGEPTRLTGRIAYSAPFLAEIDRPVRSLTGGPWSPNG